MVKKLDLNTYIHAVKRSEMKAIKNSGVGSQANFAMKEANKIAHQSTQTVEPTDFSVTLIDAAKKRVNII